MKKLFTLTAAAAALSVGAAMADDKNDWITKDFDLKDFDRIDIAGVYDLTVTVGGDYSIRMEGPAKEVERVKASVEGGELELSQQKRRGGWGGNRKGVEATISLPYLRALEISGVVDGEVENIDVEDFEVEISGVGDLDLSGRCDAMEADVSGVGDLDAEELKCRSVDISVSGVGDASVYASEEVDARVSGMGGIDVYGSPERVSKSDSMFADVTVH